MRNPKSAVEAIAERERFFELAECLPNSSDPVEIEQIKKELARLTVGLATQS